MRALGFLEFRDKALEVGIDFREPVSSPYVRHNIPLIDTYLQLLHGYALSNQPEPARFVTATKKPPFCSAQMPKRNVLSHRVDALISPNPEPTV